MPHKKSPRKTGIYSITNQINGKRYIGSAGVGGGTLHGRIRDHKSALRKNRHESPHLQNSWNKYGGKNFVFEVLEECDGNKCLEREAFWIDYFESYKEDHGYNIIREPYCFMQTLQIREAISRTLKKYYENPENRKRNSEAVKLGITEEVRAAMTRINRQNWDVPGRREDWSLAMIERWKNPEQRRKMIEGRLGIKQSEEHVAKRVKSFNATIAKRKQTTPLEALPAKFIQLGFDGV